MNKIHTYECVTCKLRTRDGRVISSPHLRPDTGRPCTYPCWAEVFDAAEMPVENPPVDKPVKFREWF